MMGPGQQKGGKPRNPTNPFGMPIKVRQAISSRASFLARVIGLCLAAPNPLRLLRDKKTEQICGLISCQGEPRTNSHYHSTAANAGENAASASRLHKLSAIQRLPPRHVGSHDPFRLSLGARLPSPGRPERAGQLEFRTRQVQPGLGEGRGREREQLG